MSRKDSEKEAERPRYYSQFWLDVAAGRRVIGAPKPDEEADEAEAETPVPEPTPLRRAGRASAAPAMDGYKETRAQTVAEPEPAPVEFTEPEFTEPEEEEFELANDVDDMELPNIVVDDTLDDTSLSDLDYLPEPEEEEEEEPELEDEEEFFDEDEEEEDEDSWSARGRKKPKPGRQVKPPKPPQKKPRREPRRGF